MKNTNTLKNKSLSELAELYKNKKVFEIALGNKLIVGKRLIEYTVTTIGGTKDNMDTIELSCGHKKIIISKK